MTKYFGTDGIRARAGEFPLDSRSLFTLGKSLVSLLKNRGSPPAILIGRDTRESGEWMVETLAKGIESAGGKVIAAGVIPTSAVAFLTLRNSFSAGVVISASHNPYHDNGIKIFSERGMKIRTEWEEILESALENPHSHPIPEDKVHEDTRHSQEYENFLIGLFESGSLPKIRVILDCANGAASFLAPRVFSRLGLDVATVGAAPNGRNINEGCGSLYPEILAAKVLEDGADIGIAYDGDADRVLWVDDRGRILNGDHTLFVLARFMQERDRLKSTAVVGTTMNNLGLEQSLKGMGLRLVRADVGDRYVLEKMLEIGANLGGEQSGHTILLDDVPSGDGILTSLRMIEVMAAEQASLTSLTEDLIEFPQTLKNVNVREKLDLELFPEILETQQALLDELQESGRLNVRYSGTESKIRIMIEGRNQKHIEALADRLAVVIAKNLGGET